LAWPAYAQPELALKSRQGKELMAAGRFEEAIPVYQDLARALPNNPGPLLNLGMALHMAGHEREAVTQFLAVLKLDPSQTAADLYLGAAYLALKEPLKAIEPLRIAVRSEPSNGEARQALGEALLAVGRFQSAADHFEKLSRLAREAPQGWNGLGLSYEGLAGRNFELLEKLALGSAYWLELVAETRVKAGQYNQAFYFYRQAQAKMPALRGVSLAIAQIYRKSGHEDWAAMEEAKELQLPALNCAGPVKSLECDFHMARYRELVSRPAPPRSAEAFYWRARAYNALALDAFSRLAGLPPSSEVYDLVAEIYFRQRKYGEAAKEWQKALNLSPGNDYYRKQLAIALSMSGQYEEARPILEELFQRAKESVEMNYWLGFTLLGLTRAADAIPFLEKAVERDPSGLSLHRDLARAYLETGQAQKAIPHLRTAAAADKDGSIYYQLARAYRSVGERELEREMLKKFANIQASESVEKQNLEQQARITAP
jgi:tetratricopeptide (TPR) repeat protein